MLERKYPYYRTVYTESKEKIINKKERLNYICR